MNALLAMVFAVSSLAELGPDGPGPVASDIAAETAFATNAVGSASGESKTVTITSARTDYDRKDGVILFSGRVKVADPEYEMRSEQLYVFLDGLNQLKRIVAIGNVAITNGLKSGACDKATYVKATKKIVMYGDGKHPTSLVDREGKRSELKGRRITFWIASEQVEVDDSEVILEGAGGGEMKSLIGK